MANVFYSRMDSPSKKYFRTKATTLFSIALHDTLTVRLYAKRGLTPEHPWVPVCPLCEKTRKTSTLNNVCDPRPVQGLIQSTGTHPRRFSHSEYSQYENFIQISCIKRARQVFRRVFLCVSPLRTGTKGCAGPGESSIFD